MQVQEKNRRILIVDDTASIHDDIRKILCNDSNDEELDFLTSAILGVDRSAKQSPGITYEIDSAYQGQDGFEMVKRSLEEQRPYAMAIVDVRMPPGWDGIETIERMKEVDPQLQIAICTAYSDYSWNQILERFGQNDWLLIFKKPFDLAEVQQLACALTEKWNLARQATLKMDDLNQLVEDHARQLRQANAELQKRNDSLKLSNERLSHEMAARQRADERIRHIAFHDTLTNLPNRMLLMDRLERCFQRSKRQSDYMYAILFLDLDNFKIVNDSLGHRAGDALLCQIAQQLQASLRSIDSASRPADETTARLGGDEFVVLLDDVRRPENALVVAERIQNTLLKPLQVEDKQIVAKVSIGVAIGHSDYNDPADIIRDADIALYHAKEMGKSRIELFDQEMRQKVTARMDLENDLRHAIEHRQFEVYYQPIISLVTGEIESFEALIRWQHPVRGLLSPDEFIPIAEETGLITLIGQWILQEVCHQIHDWKSRLPNAQDLSFSINLSPRQLGEIDLVEQIDRTLQTFHLDPSVLKLEITESMMVDSSAEIDALMNKLSARRLEIYIDDFGTGYSSLSSLHNLPIAAIKLDRAFISNMQLDGEHAATVQAVAMLARNRNIKLIAEGIESFDQLVQLQTLECELGQGYYFSKPLKVSDAESLLVSDYHPWTSLANFQSPPKWVNRSKS